MMQGQENLPMDDAATTLETFDILQLLQALPHRYPFLLVDRIIEARGDQSCIGIKNVSVNEPQFQGHFPERPVMPGVLLIEGMAQTAGALCISALAGAHPKSKDAKSNDAKSSIATSPDSKPPLVYFMTIDKAKFRKPVVPGDRVEFHMEKLSQRKTMWWYRGRALVDGVLVCEAEISAMLVVEEAPKAAAKSGAGSGAKNAAKNG